MFNITRRGTLGLGAGAVAAGLGGQAWGQSIPTANATAPRLPPENGATLRILRPARFVEPDEVIFRENTQRFTQQTGVQVRVDFVGWEDLRPQTAVIANTGQGPDVVIGWPDDPHIFADKLVEVSDIAEYLGQKYGGWMNYARVIGRRQGSNNWLAIPFGGSGGPLIYRISALREAGFDSVPTDLPGFLRLCQALRRINKPSGFALGNAVGDGNAFANWMLWSHGAYIVDENGRVAINRPETIAALRYVRELYQTFVPGTISWLDPSNNRAYISQEVWLTQNGVSLYYAAKNDPNTRAVAEDTNHADLPRGQATSPPNAPLAISGMLFRHSRFPNAAKEYLRFMMEAEQYDRWLTGSSGYWAHPLRAYGESSVWRSDPKIMVFKDTMDREFWNGYRGPLSQASGSVTAEYITVQMLASVASGQAQPEDAARDAERRIRRFYRS
ncbi:MAG TPA: ABC transporter substrate-binding protein [Acetobacteraceae bacterium]|nr:ABC transporter substrate-binding protein [Acetobacteraceae bacterium]